MSAPTLMVGATLPGSDRDVWTGEVGSLQWASRQALGAHQRALGALIAVIGSREITAGVEPAHRNGKVVTLTGRNQLVVATQPGGMLRWQGDGGRIERYGTS